MAIFDRYNRRGFLEFSIVVSPELVDVDAIISVVLLSVGAIILIILVVVCYKIRCSSDEAIVNML